MYILLSRGTYYRTDLCTVCIGGDKVRSAYCPGSGVCSSPGTYQASSTVDSED